MFNPIALVIAVAALLNFSLGILVLVRNFKKKTNVYFSIFVFAITLWTLSNFFLSVTLNPVLVRVTYAFGGFVIACALVWILELCQRNSIAKTVIIYIAGTMMTTFVMLNESVVGTVTKVTESGYEGSNGSLLPIFMLYLACFLVYAIYAFVASYRKARLVTKAQLKYVAVGIISFGLSVMLVSFVLPILGFSQASRLDSPSSLFFVGLSSYAIIKHRLLDIRLVVARSIAYLLLLSSLAAFYAVSVLGLEALLFPGQLANFDWYQGALRTVIAVVMVFLFQPLKKWITAVTDKVFFRNSYDPDALLAQLSSTMASTIVLVELLYKVGDIITNNLKASRILYALIKDDSRIYGVQAIGYKKTPEVDPHDVAKFTKDGIIHYDDLEEGSRLKHLLSEYNANVAVPLKTEGETVGVMLLGEKSSGDMYSQQDINVLEILGPELALAIENAKAYEEISRFNTTLRQEVKRATYRLKQKNEQLMELDHAKDEFISMASHQLRTPLTAIKGYLSMLLEGDAGDIKVSQYDFINEAYSGANRMVGLINDLLNVSRMDTGRFFLEPKEVDIEKVVGEEAKQLQNAAKSKGLYLKVVAKGKVPHIWADETKIRQVVMNFMDNAIYYTNTGGVTVELKHDKDNFIYEVHDTGIGVPEAQKEHLFEKFFRADNARTARPDGTGLGIYLAKRVVSDHGGEIIFESTEGKGSVFGFKFPLKKKLPTDSTSTSPQAPASGTASVAEVAKNAETAPVAAGSTKN